jgi:putative PIG3 family NAD(P)H quinone oxidoreductase
MKAIVIQTNQEGRPLVWQEVPAPDYAADEVLVDIYAAAVNRPDLMQRAGHYPPPPGASEILGLDMAGRIAAVGANLTRRQTHNPAMSFNILKRIEVGTQVTGWQVGDRVCALLPGGGYAEQVNVPASMLMPIPDDWSYEQAAAIPEVFFTAYVNLFMEANLQAGETVLIHGGASGVGTAAIQMAHQAGCQVIVTAGTDEKAARCQELGANLAINYKKEDFAARALTYTHGAGVDVIMDMVGADYLERNIRLLKLRGRLVFISTLGGSRAEVDVRQLMGKRLRLIGSVLRPRSVAEKVEIKEKFMAQFWPMLLDGAIQPIIDSIYPVEQANEAQARMAANENIGKIILKVRG